MRAHDRHALRLGALVAALATPCAPAQTPVPDATAYPTRTVQIVAAQQAGSAYDNVARVFSDALARAWGQSTIVVNRPGASGAIGTQAAARSDPDGYTLLVGGMSNMVTSPVLEPAFGVDPERGFVAIGRIAWVPFVLAVHRDVPATTLMELVAHVKASPGKVVFATSGPTAYSRLCVEQISKQYGLELLTVGYRGAPAGTVDLVAGRAQMQVNEIAAMKQHADEGRIRLLAVAGDRRTPVLPSLPTFAEAGATPIPVTPWYGLFAPAGVPADVLVRIETAYRIAMRDPDLIARLQALGYEPIVDEPGQFAAALRRDLNEVRELARRVGKLPPP